MTATNRPIFASLLLILWQVHLVEAEEFDSLPVYVSEEPAAIALEKLVRDRAEEDGVTVDLMKPMEPKTHMGFVAVGLGVRLSGPAEVVIKSLAQLDAQPFTTLPSVAISHDRRKPLVIPRADGGAGAEAPAPVNVRSDFEILQWYAADEKKAGKPKKWTKAANPPVPAVAVLSACTAKLPKAGVAFEWFDANRGSIMLVGQAVDVEAARLFGAALFGDEDLSGFDWEWVQRPELDHQKKDGTARFRIHGKQKPAKKKAAARDAG